MKAKIPPVSKSVLDQILKLHRSGLGKSAIGRELGLHRETIRKYLARYDEKAGRVSVEPKETPPEQEQVINGLEMDGSCDVVQEGRAATIDEVIKACNVDTRVWVPKFYSPTRWQGFYKRKDGESHQVVNLYRSKVTFERVIAPSMEAALLDFVREHVPAAPLATTPRKSMEGFMVSWGVFDAHIGMYAWSEEVGKSWDVKIAAQRVKNSIDDMAIELGHHSIKKILMPVGNDFMHFDSVRKKTAFGEHHLDSDSRFAKAYRSGLDCLTHMVTRALEVAEEVEVVYVPGNHDVTTSYTLAVALQCWFKQEPRVTFDLRACPRKYKQYGGVVICYDHGDGVRPDQYPRIFSQEARDLWASSTYREVQCGHFHQRRERNYEGVVPTNGLLVRVNPSLTNTDCWHFKQGLIGEPVKSVEAWRYDKIGYRGSHCVWARDDALPQVP